MRKLFIISLCVFITVSASCAFAKSEKSKDSENSKTNHSETSKADSAREEHRGNTPSRDHGSASASGTSYRPAATSGPSAVSYSPPSRTSRDEAKPSYRPVPTPSAPVTATIDRQQRHADAPVRDRDTIRPVPGTSYRPTPAPTPIPAPSRDQAPKSYRPAPVPTTTPPSVTVPASTDRRERREDTNTYRSYNPPADTARRDDSRDHRSDGVYRPSNTPSNATYSTAYHPSKDGVTIKRTVLKFAPPKGYRPPAYRDGHYYYAGPRAQRPCIFGYWAFDYCQDFSRKSVYYHFGLYPYIQVTRVVIDSYPTVTYVEQPIYLGDVASTSRAVARISGLDVALGDIRSAWISGRYDLIERHVMQDRDIAVLLDGDYDYSITGQDYLAMTNDAIGEMDTVKFVWKKVQQRTDGAITAYATHTYRVAGKSRSVYVSYTLDRIGDDFYITEVGSSAE